MGENALLHLLVVVVEPREGCCLGLVVEALQGFEVRIFWQIVFEKLNGGRAVTILCSSVNHLEPATAHRVNDGASVGEVLDVPDFEHGAVVREGLVRAVRTHPKLSGASFHCSPYHEAISRLKDVQWTRDIWKAHGADKDGYCHPSVLHIAATRNVTHFVLESFFPFCKLGRQQPPYAPLQELVDAHLGGVVRLQAGLAQRAFPLVVEASVYARPAVSVATWGGDWLPEQSET